MDGGVAGDAARTQADGGRRSLSRERERERMVCKTTPCFVLFSSFPPCLFHTHTRADSHTRQSKRMNK